MNKDIFFNWFKHQNTVIRTRGFSDALFDCYCRARNARERYLFPAFYGTRRDDVVSASLLQIVGTWADEHPRTKEAKKLAQYRINKNEA